MKENNAIKNIKLYPYYKMINYGFLFYYAVYILFLTIEKGYQPSQIMMIGSFFMICKLLLQVPVNVLIEKLGLRKSLIIGNVANCLFIVTLLLAPSIEYYILAQLFFAVSRNIKVITESNILYESLLLEGRIKEFSKLEGKSNSIYHFIDAITAVLAGYIFTFNHFLPIILTGVIAFIGLIMSIFFKEIDQTVQSEKIGSVKEYFDNFKYVIKSDRLKSIFFIAFTFTGLIHVNATLYKSLFIDLGIKPEYTGIIIAIYGIFYGMGSRSYYKIEKKTHNHTLTIFAVMYTILMTVIGLMAIIELNYYIRTGIIVSALFLMASVAGSYIVAMKKYSNSFSTQNTRTKIMTLYYTFENVGSAIMLVISGCLVKNLSNGYAAIIIGSSGLIIMTIIMMYAKKRLGLKEDEYNPKDINDLREKCIQTGICEIGEEDDDMQPMPEKL